MSGCDTIDHPDVLAWINFVDVDIGAARCLPESLLCLSSFCHHHSFVTIALAAALG